MTDVPDFIQTILDAGLAAAAAKELEDGVCYAFTAPDGATTRVLRTPAPSPEFDDHPARATATYKPATVGAFIDLVERHRNGNATTIWAHPTTGRFVAVFNDHGKLGAAWRDHRAELQLVVTPEWRRWLAQDGQLMDQVAFAEHIENGLAEIIEPAGATMLEIAQSFHAHTTATFRTAQRLQDGRVQVQFDEEVTAHAGQSGKLDIPCEFKLALRPFIGQDRAGLTALLRYRHGGGKLRLGYKLQRPDLAVEVVLDAVVGDLRERFPASVFVGEPGE